MLIIVGNNEGGSEQAQDTGPDLENLRGVLDSVQTNLAEQKWGRAEALLDSIDADLKKAPADLVERGAEYRDQIAIGQLLSKADRLIADGDVAAAAIALDDVLARDPAYLPTYYQYGSLLSTVDADKAVEVIRAGLAAAEAAGDGHTRSELNDLLEDVLD